MGLQFGGCQGGRPVAEDRRTPAASPIFDRHEQLGTGADS